MRLKWFGILVLLLALALTVPRGTIGVSILWDSAIAVVLGIGVILIIIDCRKDDKKYIESVNHPRTISGACSVRNMGNKLIRRH